MLNPPTIEDRSTTNQENAIIVYAQTTSGGSRKVGDIVKQVGSKRFKIKTADGTFAIIADDKSAQSPKSQTMNGSDVIDLIKGNE